MTLEERGRENHFPHWLLFLFNTVLKARAYVSAEIHIQQCIETDRQDEAGRQRFSLPVGRLLDIHFTVVPYHCFLITECLHSGSPPLLFLLAVHLFIGGPSVWPRCADHSLMISKTTIPHTFLFSKLLLLLLYDPLTSFLVFVSFLPRVSCLVKNSFVASFAYFS